MKGGTISPAGPAKGARRGRRGRVAAFRAACAGRALQADLAAPKRRAASEGRARLRDRVA